MPEPVIRTYQPADQDQVVALWHACGLVVPWNDPQEDIARKRAVQPELFWVVEVSEQVVGTIMAGYEGHRGWINYLAVAPGYRRGGIGRRMMQVAEDALRALGCPKINLQVRTTNGQVIAFYQRLGYTDDNVVSLGKRV